MGLFDKKYCDICGEKIGLLGNRKLENGNLCKTCAKKLSPWFSDRRNSTVEGNQGAACLSGGEPGKGGGLSYDQNPRHGHKGAP